MAELRARAVGEAPLRDPAPAEEPSLAQLVARLIAEAQALARKELALARAELGGEVARLRLGLILAAGGAALAAVGAVFLVAAAAELLVELGGLARWLAYLIVGDLLAIVGVSLLYVAMRRLEQVRLIPTETIDSLR